MVSVVMVSFVKVSTVNESVVMESVVIESVVMVYVAMVSVVMVRMSLKAMLWMHRHGKPFQSIRCHCQYFYVGNPRGVFSYCCKIRTRRRSNISKVLIGHTHHI